MRFEKSGRTPYLGKRDQFRLAMMVLLIGFIVVAIDVASRENTWYWITGNPGTVTPQGSPATPASPTSKPKIDFTPRRVDDPLPPGVVKVETVPVPGSVASRPIASEDELAVPPELLLQIADNTVGIRAAEREVYHHMLAKARDASINEQLKAASDDVAFAVLMVESQEFIGKLITVKGEVRGLRKIPPGANDDGITDLWEAWMFNADSGINPYIIRFTTLPQGIPLGMQLESGTIVEVTGYFFKRFGYPTQDDRLHVAPMILSKSMKWFRPRSAFKPDDLGLIPYVLGFAAVIGTTIIVLLWQFRASDRKFEQEHLRRLTEAPAGAIAAIEHLPTIDVTESLRHLAATDAAARADSSSDDTDSDRD